MNSMDSESESTQPQLAAGAQSGFASYVTPFGRTVWACIERRGYATIENSFHLAPGIHRRCRRWFCLERRAGKGDLTEARPPMMKDRSRCRCRSSRTCSNGKMRCEASFFSGWRVTTLFCHRLRVSRLSPSIAPARLWSRAAITPASITLARRCCPGRLRVPW